MAKYLLPFLLVILLLAALLRQDFVLSLAYLLVGAFLASAWWSRKALAGVGFLREYPPRVFLGEAIPVRLKLENRSRLPVIWLQVREILPLQLVAVPPPAYQQIVTLPPRGKVQLDYCLEGRRRGYYQIGPIHLSSGDLLGISGELRNLGGSDPLIVYPKIIPLAKVELPSRSPFGALRNHQTIDEDPSRPRGKRDYRVGDSLRRVDWKATAATGRMQVKQFEPSIALETVIFLGMNAAEYRQKGRFYDPELAIVVAASLASWIIGKRQAAGLYTNGVDPLAPLGHPRPALPRRGRGQLMHILEILARLETGETEPLARLLQQALAHLPWGTTLIVIASRTDDELFGALFGARRSGLEVVLVMIGQVPNEREIRQRAETYHFPLFFIEEERDLDMWRL